MMDVGRHPNITLLTRSELKEINGKPGNFSVKVLKHPRYVDVNTCTSCGDCSAVCPVVKPNEFELGLGSRKAIFRPFPQAVPSAYLRIREDCLGDNPIACAKCIDACKLNCINFDEQEEILNLNVGAVIVTTGIEYYDPTEASEYGYTRFENVVTSFELERLLSASGPTKGELIRFTDNRSPKRVVFINCVGSRNMHRDIPYCSRICCMNAIKDSLIIREYFPDAEICIFYIDIRAFGKGFEELYNRSLEEKVKYIKGKPSKVVEDKKTGDLILAYENQGTGKIEHMQVDMVVLSSALISSEGSKELAKILGVELARDGFFKQKDACGAPLESTHEGIYLCGCATGPKDITDSIAEASGAATKAALLVKERVEEVKMEIEPIDISGEPKIGVFVCHCGLNIAGLLPCESLAEYAKTLDNVVFSEDVLFACAESTQRQIQERVKEHNLNRVVVAACTPRTHEPIFQETLAKIGFNPYLFEMVNIRDQCSWVHIHEPEAAAQKAKDLIRMAVAKARLLHPLDKREMEVGQEILIIGSGIAGMQSAIDFANRGFKVYLVEKESRLGGRVGDLASLYPQGRPGEELTKMKIDQLNELGVKIYANTEVESIKGFVGNFEVELKSKTKKEHQKLKIGAIILAIGSDLYQPSEKHGYKKFSNVHTNMEIEQMLIQNKIPDNIKSIAFIQCVGSRGPEGNPGCSRYCCQAAIKQAIVFKEKGIDVTIFHRGIRVYAKGAEMMYRRARELGVLFLPYPDDSFPEINGEKTAESIEVYSKDLDADIVVPVDMVVLSVGMIPRAEESQRLSEILRVSRGSDRFFQERHPKFGPVETSVDGVFLCGCCQFPQDIADSIAQASAVASRASAILSKGLITLEPIVSSVDEELCRGCAKCAEICEFKAIELIEKEKGIWVARVNEALCKGCGSCCAICPTGAIDTKHFKRDQIEAELEALFE
jgi:heterodisulfide reductase subunit A